MALTKLQKDILVRIQKKLEHGDVTLIANKTKLSREYVSRVLSTTTPDYNRRVVSLAANIIADRECLSKEILLQLK